MVYLNTTGQTKALHITWIITVVSSISGMALCSEYLFLSSTLRDPYCSIILVPNCKKRLLLTNIFKLSPVLLFVYGIEPKVGCSHVNGNRVFKCDFRIPMNSSACKRASSNSYRRGQDGHLKKKDRVQTLGIAEKMHHRVALMSA